MYIGAIDLGGTKTIIGIISEKGQILSSRTITTNITDCYAHLNVCFQSLLLCMQELGLSFRHLKGIGINVPGMADIAHGILIKAVFAGWENIRIADFFKDKSGLENIFIENDVNSCAIGEMEFGYQNQYRNFLWLTISTGVGGAIVCDSHLIRGAFGCAGEIGHVKVEYESPARCPCSEFGCLEAHGSGSAISRYVREQTERDPDFASEFDKKELSYDASGCAFLADQGNPTAQGIFYKAGTYLGRGISQYINLLNPEAIIIGGGVARSLHLLKPAIQNTINHDVIDTLNQVVITATKLGYEAAFLGAAALVKHRLLF